MFFFFSELYNIDVIQKAFKNICFEKMNVDGYCDMNEFISSKRKKDELLSELSAVNSKYAILYKEPYPKKEEANDKWQELIGDAGDVKDVDLSYIESFALVFWVFKILGTREEREDFINDLLNDKAKYPTMDNCVRLSNGVLYDATKVDLHFISNLSEYSSLLTDIKVPDGKQLFFRGHARANYRLQPSIYRSEKLKKSESKMYHDLLINCPLDFNNNSSHLEKLVEMQHYGLPTRLLDVTTNPLVALYFACNEQSALFGEVILISVDDAEVKYPQSDTVSILASLAVFPNKNQEEFKQWADNSDISQVEFNEKIKRLLQEIRLEKPAFKGEIDKNDILGNFAVLATKNNQRIIKQDGAFILCGLSEATLLEKFRFELDGKKVVVLISQKEEMLKSLDTFSINHATLFPEIANVAEYIKSKYSK